MPYDYIHDYFTMDIDDALSHAAANLNKVHREVEGWDMNREDFSLPIQDWLLELTEALSFLGALTKAQRRSNTMTRPANSYERDTMSYPEGKQWYKTQLSLTLVFETETTSQNEADSAILSLSFDIMEMLHRELDVRGLLEVRVQSSEMEEKR